MKTYTGQTIHIEIEEGYQKKYHPEYMNSLNQQKFIQLEDGEIVINIKNLRALLESTMENSC